MRADTCCELLLEEGRKEGKVGAWVVQSDPCNSHLYQLVAWCAAMQACGDYNNNNNNNKIIYIYKIIHPNTEIVRNTHAHNYRRL